jgi:uncharacterized membrane protein
LRSLQVHIEPDDADRVLKLARQHGARAPLAVRAETRDDGDGDGDRAGTGSTDRVIVFVTLQNDRTGAFIDAVQEVVDDAEFVLLPVGVLTLRTPVDDVDERVTDVSRLSTLELVLASLQSVGAWQGMLLFSVLAGVIGGYGLIFDTSYLLVAAMLVNPMGAPALVSVVGLAIGDVRMFGRGGVRFVVSLSVQALAALALAVGYGLEVSTRMMEQVTALSTWGVVVALAAGAAGAQTQVKSERDSLVSGTAAGFMVAAALAPPAATLGMAIPLGRWDYVGLMAFLLGLQYLAIVVGGWLVLLLFGVRPGQPSIGRGSGRWRSGLAALAILGTLGMVAWQTRLVPDYQKADMSLAALEVARDALGQVEGVGLVEASARFVRPDLERHDGEVLLFEITAEREAAAGDDAVLEAAIRAAVQRVAAERMRDVVPLVRIDILPGR